MKEFVESKIMGGHYLLDFFGCDAEQLNSMEFWQENLPKAANAAEMKILNSHFHKFEPYGITGFLLLSTSHISVHTWPEHQYAACDVFSCSSDKYTIKAVNFLKKIIRYKKCKTEYLDRGCLV